VIFVPAIDLLVVGGMICACFLVVIVALLVNPPTQLVNKLHSRDDKEESK
jgi:integral membrane sensor domain MASE1